MLDPFGLRQEMEGRGEPARAQGGARLWAWLLAADSALLLLCTAGLAGALYLHRPVPIPVPARAARRAEPKKPVEKPAAPPAAQAARPAAPAAREAAFPPRTAPVPKGPLGSPSVLAPDLPRREASLAGSGRSSAPAARQQAKAAGDSKIRAKPVDFSHRAPQASEVLLRAPFLVRTGGSQRMSKSADGNWHLSVSLLPGRYKYHFLVDGKGSKPYSLEVH